MHDQQQLLLLLGFHSACHSSCCSCFCCRSRRDPLLQMQQTNRQSMQRLTATDRQTLQRSA
jgi:hypothetical protein